jgi:hypothetical protein
MWFLLIFIFAVGFVITTLGAAWLTTVIMVLLVDSIASNFSFNKEFFQFMVNKIHDKRVK